MEVDVFLPKIAHKSRHVGRFTSTDYFQSLGRSQGSLVLCYRHFILDCRVDLFDLVGSDGACFFGQFHIGKIVVVLIVVASEHQQTISQHHSGMSSSWTGNLPKSLNFAQLSRPAIKFHQFAVIDGRLDSSGKYVYALFMSIGGVAPTLEELVVLEDCFPLEVLGSALEQRKER